MSFSPSFISYRSWLLVYRFMQQTHWKGEMLIKRQLHFMLVFRLMGFNYFRLNDSFKKKNLLRLIANVCHLEMEVRGTCELLFKFCISSWNWQMMITSTFRFMHIKSSEKWKRLICLFLLNKCQIWKVNATGDWWTIDFILLTTIKSKSPHCYEMNDVIDASMLRTKYECHVSIIFWILQL